MQDSSALSTLLAAMRLDAQRYFVIDGMPGCAGIADAIAKAQPGYWSRLAPLDRFFVLESMPELAADHAPRELTAAYAAAAVLLPGDWWAFGNPANASCTRRMLALPGILSQLKTLLTDQTKLRMLDGEDATLCKLYKWEAGDLAGMMLTHLQGVEFDRYAPLQLRQEARLQLAQELPDYED
jgi:hypothetical protein